MMNVSHRGDAMPASPIRKLVPYADAAKADGVKVYHLNIGQPDLPTPQKALDALKHIDRKTLEYSPSQGLQSLEDKFRGYYSRYGITLDRDEIIVTTGGSEALLFTFLSFLIRILSFYQDQLLWQNHHCAIADKNYLLF